MCAKHILFRCIERLRNRMVIRLIGQYASNIS